MSRLRVGYVGCGHLAQLVHIPNLVAASDRCVLSAIAEVRPKLARQVAEHWRIPRVHASHRELAADREIDAVVVSGHWATQGDIAMELLAAGKHVLMEKPMAASVEQGERIVATARASGRRLMVAYMKRYDAGNVLLKATLDRCRADGSLGRLRYVRNQAILGDWTAGLSGPYFGTDEPHPAPTDHWPSWLPEAHRHGYFGYIQQYTHNINFLRWLLDAAPGAVTPRAVLLDPQDGLSGLTALDIGGTLVCVESGGMRHHEWNERTSCFFDQGAIESSMFTLLLRNVPSTVEIYAKGERDAATRTELFPANGRSWAYRNEVDHFLECLSSGAPFRSSAEDALEDVRVLEAIYRRHAVPAAMRGAA
jgi:predicted dehydrogenase